MVIKEYILNTDRLNIKDAITIKKEIFFRQHPDIKNDKDFKELMTIKVIDQDNKKILQFSINE